MKFTLATTGSLLLAGNCAAWSPSAHPIFTKSVKSPFQVQANINNDHGEVQLGSFYPDGLDFGKDSSSSKNALLAASGIVPAAALFTPLSAEAASATSNDPIPSALAAYGHYLSLIVIVAALMIERVTVKPKMSVEEEKLLGYADISLGVAGIALLVSGYYRATVYGKGWDFYSHEPLFWTKMAFLGIFGGLSLFPTITIIKRTVAIQTGKELEPMSEKLAKRMVSVLNAELSAVAFIPLTATLMSRGVGYVNDFPTQIVGPAIFALITGGAVYKYAGDALKWKEE